ncbi:MAG: hypothetical protein LC117_10505 [Bacteroidia bacterium]|nr:hypothetical protein [Bacteroidia bacterium]MCZ2278346.1 hypothetical protein [Bacteroidia bacterium]
MKHALLLALGCIGLLLPACEKDSGPVYIKPADTLTQSLISYAGEIQPLLTTNCALPGNCHNEFHPMLNLLPCCSYDQLLFSGASAPYVDTLSPEESLLYLKITSFNQTPPQMPPGGPYMTQEETGKILEWIAQGAKNN